MVDAIKVEGANELVAAFGRLPFSMRKKVLRGALKEGAKAVKARAADNVRSVVSNQSTGLLARSISIYSGRGASRDQIRVIVAITANKTARNGARVGLYGSVLEFGKENQPPRPWLRPAAQQSTQQVIQMTSAYGRQHLADAVADAKQ